MPFKVSLFVLFLLMITASAFSGDIITLTIPQATQTYRAGDIMPAIFFSGKKDLHVYVFHVNAGGEYLLLWPEPYHYPEMDSFLKAGETNLIEPVYRFTGDYSGEEQFVLFGFQRETNRLGYIKQTLVYEALRGRYHKENPIARYLKSDDYDIVKKGLVAKKIFRFYYCGNGKDPDK